MEDFSDAPSLRESREPSQDHPLWAPYVSRPREIIAYQYREAMGHAHLLDGDPLPPGVLFSSGQYNKRDRTVSLCRVCVLTMHEQRVYLEDGDWVVPEPVPGRFYPIKPEVFARTYESNRKDGSSPQNNDPSDLLIEHKRSSF